MSLVTGGVLLGVGAAALFLVAPAWCTPTIRLPVQIWDVSPNGAYEAVLIQTQLNPPSVAEMEVFRAGSVCRKVWGSIVPADSLASRFFVADDGQRVAVVKWSLPLVEILGPGELRITPTWRDSGAAAKRWPDIARVGVNLEPWQGAKPIIQTTDGLFMWTRGWDSGSMSTFMRIRDGMLELMQRPTSERGDSPDRARERLAKGDLAVVGARVDSDFRRRFALLSTFTVAEFWMPACPYSRPAVGTHLVARHGLTGVYLVLAGAAERDGMRFALQVPLLVGEDGRLTDLGRFSSWWRSESGPPNVRRVLGGERCVLNRVTTARSGDGFGRIVIVYRVGDGWEFQHLSSETPGGLWQFPWDGKLVKRFFHLLVRDSRATWFSRHGSSFKKHVEYAENGIRAGGNTVTQIHISSPGDTFLSYQYRFRLSGDETAAWLSPPPPFPEIKRALSDRRLKQFLASFMRNGGRSEEVNLGCRGNPADGWQIDAVTKTERLSFSVSP